MACSAYVSQILQGKISPSKKCRKGYLKTRGKAKFLLLLSYELWKKVVTKHMNWKPIQHNHESVSDTICLSPVLRRKTNRPTYMCVHRHMAIKQHHKIPAKSRISLDKVSIYLQISNYLWWRDVSLKHISWLFVLNIFNKGSIWKVVLVQFIKCNWLHKLCQDFPEKLKKKQSSWSLALQMPRLVFSRQM